MSSQMTTAAQVVNNLEYYEESTYDTFPTNPAMIFLAQTAVVKITRNDNVKAFRRLGSEDPFKFIAGKQEYMLTLEFAIANTTFLAYGINAVSGAGTINKSLSLGWSYPLDGTTNYRTATGCRIQTIRIKGDTETNELRCSVDIIPATISVPSTSDYKGSGSHASADSTAPLTFYSGGTDPIVFNSAAVPVTSINATWTRNLSNKRILGKQNIKYQYPTNRQQVGDVTLVLLANTIETALNAGTTASLVWTINSVGPKTITWSNARFTQLTDETFNADTTDGVEQAYTFEALSSAVN